MAFSESEIKRCERELEAFLEERRPPPHLRDKVDLAYRLDGQAVDLFEIRANCNDPSTKHDKFIARAEFVKSRQEWRIYWMRADLKRHRYDPVPKVRSLREFLNVVAEDQYGCFFG